MRILIVYEGKNHIINSNLEIFFRYKCVTEKIIIMTTYIIIIQLYKLYLIIVIKDGRAIVT